MTNIVEVDDLYEYIKNIIQVSDDISQIKSDPLNYGENINNRKED